MVAGQTVLSDNIEKLLAVPPQMTLEEFEAATTPEKLREAAQNAQLPGAPAAPKKKSNAVALGVGLGVGLGVPALAGLGWAAWKFGWFAGRGGGSALGAPMLG